MSLALSTEKRGNTLVVHISGRLDAHAADRVDEVFQELEGKTWIVLELSGMNYISSSGLRIFVSLHKALNGYKGKLALAGLQPYCLEVLRISGFDSYFFIYPSLEEAVAVISEHSDRHELPCGKFVFRHGSDEPGGLEVLGAIEDVLACRITPERVQPKKFSAKAYSLGLGALGPDTLSVMPYLGEMMTIGGTMVWLPTDGHDTPDFLVPHRDSDEVVIRTGFNVSLSGPFNEYVEFESSESGGTTLADLYRGLFDLARQRRPDYKGALGLAMRAEMSAVYGCGVVKSPVAEHAPANGLPITDPSNYSSWFEIDATPRLHAVTGLICSIGVDLKSDLSGLEQKHLNAAFYLNPGNRDEGTERLHSHGVFFQPFPLGERPLELEREIQSVVEQAEFLDMRHLFDRTTVQWALIGVIYVQDVWPDRGPAGGWEI